MSIALANPLQVSRTAALMLFDPQLIVLGAAGFMIYGVFYPFVIGTVCAFAGYFMFRRGDLP